MMPPLRLAIVNDYSVVIAGIAAMLAAEDVDMWRPAPPFRC